MSRDPPAGGVMGKVLPGGGVMVGYELLSRYTGTSFQGAELAIINL